MSRTPTWLAVSCCLLLLLTTSALPVRSVTFHDIVPGGKAGLTYTHQPSTRLQTQLGYQADGDIDVNTEYVVAPFKPYGAPGVAIFDFDGDGDEDIFVANGPGAPNSLFKNLLKETGQLKFVDVAVQAGVDAPGMDAQGVCYGDIDNDGHEDLLVLGNNGNRLFQNQGNGTFRDITVESGLAALPLLNGASCSMGDVNGDGLLDIAIANTFDFSQMLPLTTTPDTLNFSNQLLINKGGNVFADASQSSGINQLAGVQPGISAITWGVSMIDFNQDGLLDIIFAEDFRGSAPTTKTGYLRYMKNDGTGHFTDVTAQMKLDKQGSWRGLAFGDLNCDGNLDLFATNFGDYIFFPGTSPLGAFSSRWFLGQADHTVTDPGPGAVLKTVPTGWGTAITDYDNDGAPDIVAYGGQDNILFLDESNPGILLHNTGCSANFTWDSAANPHPIIRNVEGLAVGDLNDDGFPDIVSVSSFDLGPNPPVAPDFSNPLGSPFDVTAFALFWTVPTADPNHFKYTGFLPVPGTLSVEINSADSGNNWIKVKALGTVGLTRHGVVNRDGIGAVVKFVPRTGKPVVQPILGGSSYASQNSLKATFGLGHMRQGMVEVLWPGGVKNRLYGVHAAERLLLPEIPCSFAANWKSAGDYTTCVASELDRLREAKVIDPLLEARLFVSALKAYFDTHPSPI
ncbi:MAG: CRTAC1 family protein [Acidobacteriota bacterium]|nr:CRTAC1 family protein [Acidobacteriota bacterium]